MYIKAECMLYMWVSIDEITLTDIYMLVLDGGRI